VKYLVSQGADVHAKTNMGYTPLHVVRYVDTAKYLVSQGADVNAKMGNGKTPLDVARERKYTAVVQYLESVK